MMDDILSLQRRVFLQQAAGTVAIAVVSHGAAATVSAQRTLVIYQQRDSASLEFAEVMRSQGMRSFAIDDDAVRVWRDQLRRLVVDEGYRMLGRTGYPIYFMLRGLAAEHRIFPHYEHQPSSGHFDWLI